MNPLPEEKHSSLEQCPFCELDTHKGESGFYHIRHELAAHLPFSFGAALTSFAIIWLITELGKLGSFQSAFHIFHPAHLFLSATATTAMFWRHDRKIIKAILIGALGTIPICAISDIFMPYLGGEILGKSMALHICLIEEPLLVYPFVALGIMTGIVASNYLRHITFFSHSAHILVSSLASLLYIISFGLVDWVPYLGGLVIIVVLSVLIPCCLSDIVFPLLFIHAAKENNTSAT
ncbi:MAG: hypothetical protein HY811_02850 [Planctomycetes bacterium]|nr:hypothetical protein [Planctomycetota bacterium]